MFKVSLESEVISIGGVTMIRITTKIGTIAMFISFLLITFSLIFFVPCLVDVSFSQSSSGKWVIEKMITETAGGKTTTTNFYDENGNNIRSEMISIAQGFKNEMTTRNSFDSKGFLTKSLYTNSVRNMTTTSMTEYTNNSEGKSTKMVTTPNNDASLASVTENVYDACGNVIQNKSYSVKFPTIITFIQFKYEYQSDCRIISQITVSNNVPVTKTVYEYNAEGQKVRSTSSFLSVPGASKTIVNFAYDSNGNLCKTVSGASVTTYVWKKL